MRIAVTADLHGHLPEEVPAADLLIIAGDVCPDGHRVGSAASEQMTWMEATLRPWLQRLQMPVIAIAGNHDFVARDRPGFVRGLPWTYLEDESTSIDDLLIHGTPWTPPFYNWAFMKTEEELLERWHRIPAETDILVSHGPPYGFGDRTHRGARVGSTTLTRHIPSLSNLRLIVFGHIHEAPGVWHMGRITLINATHVNLRCRPAHPIHVLEIGGEHVDLCKPARPG